MNRQEIFDKVVAHLRQQGCKSETSEGSVGICMYRGDEGRMCAVGCLIPDEHYDESLENQIMPTSFAQVTSNPLVEVMQDIGIAEEHWRLLYDLQKVHDKSEVKEWEWELSVLASRENLIYTNKEEEENANT